MKLYRTASGIFLERADRFFLLEQGEWDVLVNRDDLHAYLESLPVDRMTSRSDLPGETLLPPIGSQEIWASGVTYYRSRTARMREAERAGGGDFYDKVYEAERPELFFKAPPHRTAGPEGKVRIRRDSTWDVPEPELTLFISSNAKIVGYTIGNDMSSRSIEGENPLYLPQAKTYDRSAALGPCLYVPAHPIDSDTRIAMQILRAGDPVYDEQIAISQMKRSHEELVGFLYRECAFPTGCFLMTGTGLVPPDEFTLASGDEIRIRIDGIGTLVNYVE
mgnify:CR=1 FL=1